MIKSFSPDCQEAWFKVQPWTFHIAGLNPEAYEGVNWEDIYIAIRDHTDPDYKGDHLLTLFLRDADKLANLRNEDIMKWSVLQDNNNESAKKYRGLSSEVRRRFNDGLIIHTEDHVTSGDEFLGKLAWLFDIGLQATVHIIREEKIPDRILSLLKHYVLPNDVIFARDVLEEFKDQPWKALFDFACSLISGKI